MTTADRWLVRLGGPPAPERTLVVVPHTVGSPSAFRRWASVLPPTVELIAVNMPGHERRVGEAPLTRLEPIADAIAEVVAARPGPPVAVLGHSQGAIIAFEVVRRLEAVGFDVEAFVASGCWAPHLAFKLAGGPGPDAPDDEVLASLKRLGGLPEAVGGSDLVELVIPVWRADAAVSRAYRFHAAFPPLACPVAAYHAEDDALVARAAVEEWAQHTRGRFTFRSFPGDHFYLFDERYLTSVVAAVAEDVAASRASR